MLELNFGICDVRSKRFLIWFQLYWSSLDSIVDYSRCPRNFIRLMVGSCLGRETVVELLLDKGVDLESEDESHGQTPLSLAAESGHEAVLKLLLGNDANWEPKAKFGLTPLSWAATRGHEASSEAASRERHSESTVIHIYSTYHI